LEATRDVKTTALPPTYVRNGKPMKLNDLTRTQLQNDRMWPMLRDVSKQVQFVVNGVLTYVDEYDVKDIMTAALRKHTRMAQGIDGGVVFLGMRTSKMKKDEMIDLIELIYAFGSERGVVWSEPTK
jgi:hypothetical protein